MTSEIKILPPRTMGIRKILLKAIKRADSYLSVMDEEIFRYPHMPSIILELRQTIPLDVKKSYIKKERYSRFWDVPEKDLMGVILKGESKIIFNMCLDDDLPIVILVDEKGYFLALDMNFLCTNAD